MEEDPVLSFLYCSDEIIPEEPCCQELSNTSLSLTLSTDTVGDGDGGDGDGDGAFDIFADPRPVKPTNKKRKRDAVFPAPPKSSRRRNNNNNNNNNINIINNNKRQRVEEPVLMLMDPLLRWLLLEERKQSVRLLKVEVNAMGRRLDRFLYDIKHEEDHRQWCSSMPGNYQIVRQLQVDDLILIQDHVCRIVSLAKRVMNEKTKPRIDIVASECFDMSRHELTVPASAKVNVPIVRETRYEVAAVTPSLVLRNRATNASYRPSSLELDSLRPLVESLQLQPPKDLTTVKVSAQRIMYHVTWKY